MNVSFNYPFRLLEAKNYRQDTKVKQLEIMGKRT